MRKIFFLIIAAIVAFFWGDDVSLDKITDMSFLSGKKNIVVMGCDVRKDDVGRSDTLFVVMLDKSKKKCSPALCSPGYPGEDQRTWLG